MLQKKPLPYEKNALEPYISEETLNFHYDKHLQTYYEKLNSLISGTEFETETLENIVKSSSGAIFNNAAQSWNHEFYFNCLTPNSSKTPTGKIADLINRDFGNFVEFKNKFIDSAVSNFGSGWTWLILNTSGNLEIINSSNAENPLNSENKILLCVDVWEHSYYIDTRNNRKAYLENFFEVINWDFVNKNLERDFIV